MIFLRLSFILALFTLGSCGAKHSGPQDVVIEKDNQPITESMKTYSYVYANIIAKQCIDCHAVGKRKPFLGTSDGLPTPEAYQLLFIQQEVHPPQVVAGDAMNSRLYTSILSGVMPPKDNTHRVSNKELQIIEAWIRDGAKFGAQDPLPPPPPPPPPPLELNFEKIKSEVLASACISCHFTGNKNKRLPLDNYNDVKKIIVEKDYLKSGLYKWITRTDGSRMPYEDLGGVEVEGKSLPEDKIKLIVDWITNGAPEK